MCSRLFRTIKYIVALQAMLLITSGVVRAESWRSLNLNVTGIEADRGGMIQVFVFLEDGFPIKHKKALNSYIKPVRGSEATVSIKVPADTAFALKVHHDEDGNKKVTKNWTGIFPAEGFGFSAGAKMSPLPPTFDDAKMVLPGTGVVSISMRYP